MNPRLTIGRKLTLGVATLGVFLLVLSYTSLRSISILGRSLDTAVNSTAKKLDLIGATQEAFQEGLKVVAGSLATMVGGGETVSAR